MSSPRRQNEATGGPLARAIRFVWSHSAVRYLLVGGVAFLVDVSLLALLHDWLAVPLVIATPAAFLLSFGVTYFLQRLLTFGTESSVASSAVKYTALVAFNTIATTAIVAGVAALGPAWIIGKIVAVASTTVWNYFAYRYWVFAAPRRKSSP